MKSSFLPKNVYKNFKRHGYDGGQQIKAGPPVVLRDTRLDSRAPPLILVDRKVTKFAGCQNQHGNFDEDGGGNFPTLSRRSCVTS